MASKTQETAQWIKDCSYDIAGNLNTREDSGLLTIRHCVEIIDPIIAKHAPKQRGLLAKDANREYLGRIRALIECNSRIEAKLHRVTDAAIAVIESTRGVDGVEMPPSLGSLEKLSDAIVS